MEKKKISIVSMKSLIIMYLAISKIHYWIDIIREMAAEDVAISSIMVLNRTINRDLPIIMVAICFLIMETKKGKLYKKLILGFIITVSAYTIYTFTLRFILGLFFTLADTTWWLFYMNFTISFFAAGIVLNIKKWIYKKKEDKAMDIEYRPLGAHECERIKEINPARFIKRAWRKVNGVYDWIDLNWKDDDYPGGYEEHLAGLKATFEGGGFAIGALCGGQLVGFVSVNRDVFGSQYKYVLLDQLFVDNQYQNNGIGKMLFYMSAEKAKEWGVDKLYICAGSSEDTLAFYRALGCLDAKEINKQLYENDENDIQMEYGLC